MTKIYLPRETTALSLGVEDLISAIEHEAAARDIAIQIVRNESRGAAWLEPLLEIEFNGSRIGYGPVTTSRVQSLFDADFLNA